MFGRFRTSPTGDRVACVPRYLGRYRYLGKIPSLPPLFLGGWAGAPPPLHQEGWHTKTAHPRLKGIFASLRLIYRHARTHDPTLNHPGVLSILTRIKTLPRYHVSLKVGGTKVPDETGLYSYLQAQSGMR